MQGRSSRDPVKEFKVLILQSLLSTFEKAMEVALADRTSWRMFTGFKEHILDTTVAKAPRQRFTQKERRKKEI